MLKSTCMAWVKWTKVDSFKAVPRSTYQNTHCKKRSIQLNMVLHGFFLRLTFNYKISFIFLFLLFFRFSYAIISSRLKDVKFLTSSAKWNWFRVYVSNEGICLSRHNIYWVFIFKIMYVWKSGPDSSVSKSHIKIKI